MGLDTPVTSARQGENEKLRLSFWPYSRLFVTFDKLRSLGRVKIEKLRLSFWLYSRLFVTLQFHEGTTEYY